MISLKHQSIFRQSSRPPSPSSIPDSPVVAERARSLARASFGLQRSSLTPATSRSPTPAPLTQDGSYLEALSLRLSEAVSKALAQPSGPSLPNELLAGRRPIPGGRGHALGALIRSELQAAEDNSHLYRAILRSLHKPLSVMLSNMSALLLPLLASPAFAQSLTIQMPTPNATQLHAVALAEFAGELLLSFDDMSLGIDTENRVDGLKSIRTGLVSLIGRVVNPLIAGVNAELMPLVDALQIPAYVSCDKTAINSRAAHPSITALQSLVPLYARALARYTTTGPSQGLLASFLISIVWRALVALSHRLTVSQTSLEKMDLEKMDASHDQYVPSQNALPATRLFGLKRRTSRPPSPVVTSSPAADARALYDILSLLPRPAAYTPVAREAVDEAFVHLKALVALLDVAGDSFEAHKSAEEIADEIDTLTDDLPTLIALPVLLRMRCLGAALGPRAGNVAALLDMPEDEYRKSCLTGFGRAEQCGPIIARRALNMIYSRVGDPPECLADWLEGRLCQSDD